MRKSLREKSRFGAVGFVSFLLSGMLLAGCSSVNLYQAGSAGVKALQAATISDAYVEGIVGEYIQQLDAQNTIATGNDPYAVRLNRVTAPINGKDGINIKVYKTNDVNAFAVADGNVRVYSGLMDIMSDEELLGVIGHEIGHVRNKDTKNAFRQALLSSALREGIASTGGVVGTLSASEIGAIGQALSQSQYSQKQELAADEYGYKFLKENGVNPWAMAMSLQRLAEIQSGGTSTPGLQQLFSTHPDIGNRYNKLAKKAQSEGFKKPGEGGSLSITPSAASAAGSSSGASGSGAGSVVPATTSPAWTF